MTEFPFRVLNVAQMDKAHDDAQVQSRWETQKGQGAPKAFCSRYGTMLHDILCNNQP